MTTITTFCGHCGRLNRLPGERLEQAPRCGHCQQPLFALVPLAASDANFDRLISSDLPVLVDFWASWCGPCRQFAPVFEALAREQEPRLRCVKLDTEAQPQLAARFAIRSIPTLMLFRQGKLLGQMQGALPKGVLLQWLDSQLAQI